ncbi:hypothetical protein KRIGEM_03196 [Komagataeibacter rhaeticus]|nr:hypothetical protein KRIGEM_03196 [Komagataeibacter rhaeticus]
MSWHGSMTSPIHASMNSCPGTGKPTSRSTIPSPPEYARVSRRMLTSIHQPVRHKIHGPDPVGKGRNRQLFWLFANQTLAGFNPQVEFLFPIDPINPLMIPELSLHIAQIQETQTKSPSPVSLGQSHQKSGNPVVLRCQSRTIAKAGLGYPKNPTGQRNADPMMRHSLCGQFPALGWPLHFFPRVSFRISVCMLKSAYMRFSRRFSSSKAFI